MNNIFLWCKRSPQLSSVEWSSKTTDTIFMQLHLLSILEDQNTISLLFLNFFLLKLRINCKNSFVLDWGIFGWRTMNHCKWQFCLGFSLHYFYSKMAVKQLSLIITSQKLSMCLISKMPVKTTTKKAIHMSTFVTAFTLVSNSYNSMLACVFF